MNSPGSRQGSVSHQMKRVQRACEACRRKKSRCPGERPACSSCSRLKQKCVYIDRPKQARHFDQDRSGMRAREQDKQSSSRLGTVEYRLDQLMSKPESQTGASIDQHNMSDGPGGYVYSRSLPQPPFSEPPEGGIAKDPSASSSRASPPCHRGIVIPSGKFLPRQVIDDAYALYFRHFHNQPYPVLLSRVYDRGAQLPKIVLYPMLAITLRTTNNLFFRDRETLTETLDLVTSAAWDLLADAHKNGEIGLSYLQGLCLLIQADWASGRPRRARAQLALGLAHIQGDPVLLLGTNDGAQPEPSSHVEAVYWTLFMMDCMMNGSHAKLRLREYSTTRHHPSISEPYPGTDVELDDAKRLQLRTLWDGGPATQYLGIVSANIELFTIWERMIAEIRDVRSNNASSPGFWKDGSVWMKIQTSLLEFEIASIHPHRYNAVHGLRHEPHLRPYFVTWSYLQVLYSAIHCLLHHPFLIFVRSRRYRGLPPLTLLQRCQENAITHSQWIIRHIVEMEMFNQPLYDPFMGHLVAVAATVQLESIRSKRPEKRAVATRNLDTARAYLQRLAKDWPVVANTYTLVRQIEGRFNSRPNFCSEQDPHDGAVPLDEIQDPDISNDDVDLMWQLFDYPPQSTPSRGEDGPIVASWSAHDDTISATDNSHPAGDHTPLSGQGIRIGIGQQVMDDTLDGISFDGAHVSDFAAQLSEDWSLWGKPWSAYFSEDAI